MKKLLVIAMLAGACGKHLYNQDDLTVAMGKHHIDLRWGRIGNAALAVKPEMREAFMKSWVERSQEWELQDIEVASVAMSPDGDAADVIVNVTYIERDTMSVKSAVVSEHWVRTDDGWLAEKPAEL